MSHIQILKKAELELRALTSGARAQRSNPSDTPSSTTRARVEPPVSQAGGGPLGGGVACGCFWMRGGMHSIRCKTLAFIIARNPRTSTYPYLFFIAHTKGVVDAERERRIWHRPGGLAEQGCRARAWSLFTYRRSWIARSSRSYLNLCPPCESRSKICTKKTSRCLWEPRRKVIVTSCWAGK